MHAQSRYSSANPAVTALSHLATSATWRKPEAI
jgi:hypothetical protein